MRNPRIALLALLLSFAGVVHGMDGVFDRSSEVDKYVSLMSTATRGRLSVVAREISVSGISDPRLAAAMRERLLADYKTIGNDREADTYGVWMARALASFGIAEYAATLRTVASGSKNSKTRAAARDAIKDIDWNRSRNALMASRKYYDEGDDPAVARLMNLLMSDDFSFKHYAAERMNWERVLDKRLMAAIAPQVQQYLDGGDRKLNNQEDDTISNFVKLLGYSKDVQYRPLLESVLASKNTSPGVKRHAKYALDKLF